MFLVPAHGRLEISRVCLRQLRRTCDTLTANGIVADAVVVADDENLDIAAGLGFATIDRINEPLGRKWNDAYQFAGGARVYDSRILWDTPADFVVPIGSDDWIDAATLLEFPLPGPNEIRCFRRSAVVNEDGSRLTRLNITYDGGDGVRVIPTALLEPFEYRPADEDRARAIDTSVWTRFKDHYTPDKRPRLVYRDLHPLQIVDFKTLREQLNPYEGCRESFRQGAEIRDPWAALSRHYPAEAIRGMQDVYRNAYRPVSHAVLA